eukprot:g15969.t1
MALTTLADVTCDDDGASRWNILPAGNAFFYPDHDKHILAQKKQRSLGPYFSRLPDKLLIEITEYLELVPDLAQSLAPTSFAWYRYVHANEDPWRNFGHDRLRSGDEPWPAQGGGAGRRGAETTNDESGGTRIGNSGWRKSWRDTVVGRSSGLGTRCAAEPLFSDCLYQPQFCASLDIQENWTNTQNLKRIRFESVTPEDFEKSEPFLLENCPVELDIGDSFKFSPSAFYAAHAAQRFICGGVEMTLAQWKAYADHVTSDETPLFVFDRELNKKCPELRNVARGKKLSSYSSSTPLYRDLFDVFETTSSGGGGYEKYRPDNRWLLVGSAKSGSKWHKDPNLTSAVNLTLCGRKKWFFLPPSVQPPGVVQSEDGAEVCQPVSLVEWLLNFYENDEARGDRHYIEGVCGPGEMVFIPKGWWHAVLNLENDTIAVTENFTTESILGDVREFLRQKPDQVSGVPCELRGEMGAAFDHCLRSAGYGELLEKIDLAKKSRTMGDCNAALLSLKRSSSGVIVDATSAAAEEATGSFWTGLRKPLSFKRKKK